MSIIQGTAKSGGSTSFYDFPIEQSLRFDGSSYLSRTPTTAGNRTTWTWSSWFKKSVLGSGVIFQQREATASSQQFQLSFLSDSAIRVIDQNSGNQGVYDTVSLYRDLSAWYHVIISCDTTDATASDRVKLYVNGERITDFVSPDDWPSPYDTSVNNTVRMLIGVQFPNTGGSLNNYFNGYMANIQFIDGQALDQYFFGEFKDNIWVPYNAFSTAGSGTATASDGDTATDSYGTNGFHLLFDSEYKLQSDVVGGNDGTNYGVTLVYDADYGDNVAKFDGSQYIAIPTSGTAYYISAWVYYDGTDTTGVINRTVHYLTWWRGFDLYLNQGKAKIFLYNANPPGNSVLESTGSLVMGWNHVYFEVTTSAHKLVLNNGAVDTNGHTISWAGSNTLHFGRRLLHSTYTSYFTGKLADVKLFSSQLSASEITSLYNKEEVTNGLIAHYPLNDDLGRTFKDFSGNGNNWQAN